MAKDRDAAKYPARGGGCIVRDETDQRHSANHRRRETIQRQNGPAGCERTIISQCQGVWDAMQFTVVPACRLASGRDVGGHRGRYLRRFRICKMLPVSMRPAVRDTRVSPTSQKSRRTQTIMLGFSDGTKDGGYLMAIGAFTSQRRAQPGCQNNMASRSFFLTAAAVPPARGAARLTKFYSSMAKISPTSDRADRAGQTVISNFGTVGCGPVQYRAADPCRYLQSISIQRTSPFRRSEEDLMRQLADESYVAYEQLKDHPSS